MWKSGDPAQPSQISEGRERYYKIQMKAWTSFDPMDKTVSEIADAIEQGDGFLSVVEVLEAVDSLASVNDEEIRDGFANILAAKRLLGAVDNLPKRLREELRSALAKTKDSDVETSIPKKKVVSSVEDFGRAQRRVEDATSGR